MATQTWVNIGSGMSLLPDGTEQLPESMLTYHWDPMAFSWRQFHSNCSRYRSLQGVWKLHILKYSYITQRSMVRYNIYMYLYECIHVSTMPFMLSKDIVQNWKFYLHHLKSTKYMPCIAASFWLYSFFFIYHILFLVDFFSFFFLSFIVSFLFCHVSVSLFGHKISLSKCNITGAHKPSQVSCSLCSYFCFHIEWPILVFLYVISCFSHWMTQILNALILVVMDFYFANELSWWKSNTMQMCYIIRWHDPPTESI